MSRARLLLALCGVVCALLLAEGAARLHGDVLCSDQPGVVYQSDARFGWTFVPGVRGVVGSCGSEIAWGPLSVDSHGLAQPERGYEKPPGTVRVLLLGGNLPAGLGVPTEATLPRLLESLADPTRGARLEVINGGVGGFVLDNDLAFFRHEGRRYAPDVVVVVLESPGELIAISPTAIRSRGQRAPLKPYFKVEDGRAVEMPAFAPVPEPALPPLPGNAFLRSFQLYRNWHRLPRTIAPPMQWADVSLPASSEAEQRATAEAPALVRALLVALREETEAAGAKLIVFVAPQGGTPQRSVGWQLRSTLVEIPTELGIPTLDPAAVFSINESARQMYIPGTGRWSASGHSAAAGELWRFLREGDFIPSVVPTRAIGATPAPPLREVPQALLRALADARWSLPVRFVVYGLLGVCLLWMLGPSDATVREWLVLAVSMAVLAAVVGPRIAGGAFLFALVFYVVVERLPRVAGTVTTTLLLAGLVLATVALRPEHVEGENPYLVVLLAVAGNVALLRLVAYAVERRRGAARLPVRAYLLALFYFPTFGAGPIETPHGFAARVGSQANPGADPLAPLRAVPRALLRLALGVLELLLVLVLLNKIGPEVFLSGGTAFGRARLWLWVGEITASLTLLLAGWSNVVIALGMLAGIQPVENFDALWRAGDVADFWRRWHVTFTRWLHAYVYEPLGGARGNAALSVLVVFVVSSLWVGWALVKIVGYRHYPVTAWLNVLVWGLLNAGAVVVAHRRAAGPARGTVARVVAGGATLVVVSLLWIPWFLPAWQSPLAAVPIYLRLFFLH